MYTQAAFLSDYLKPTVYWTSLSFKVDGTDLLLHIGPLSIFLLLFLSTVYNPRQTLKTIEISTFNIFLVPR